MDYRDPLSYFFSPKSVAVIGATDREATVGCTVLANLRSGKYDGKVYAVNPHRTEVLGLPSYANFAAIPEKIDLAVVVTPAATVPGVIRECVDAGARSAIVISAGFRNVAPKARSSSEQIQAELNRGTMRLIGPNCLGMMNPSLGPERHFRERHRPAGQRGLSQPKRRAAAPRFSIGA